VKTNLPSLNRKNDLVKLAELQAKINKKSGGKLPDPPAIRTLKGKDGIDGKPGRDGVDGRNGRDGKHGRNGKDGIDGSPGKQGVPGDEGKRGVSISDAEVTFDNHLVLYLDDGSEIDAGLINITSNNSTVVQVVQKDREGDMNLTVRYDQVDPGTAYKGDAITGAAESAPLWKIQKLVYGSDGDVTVTYASGVQDFRFIWDDRASLTYS
jgi:hypothetical protein